MVVFGKARSLDRLRRFIAYQKVHPAARILGGTKL
jgi:hypothetical protein